jgi:hypothetical protein
MGVFRNMGKRSNLFLNKKGQSAVEYILLLAVVSTLMFTLVNSKSFKDFLGKDSGFFKTLAEKYAVSYRHGLLNGDDDLDYTGHDHVTFYNEGSNTSRFFTNRKGYPQ